MIVPLSIAVFMAACGNTAGTASGDASGSESSADTGAAGTVSDGDSDGAEVPPRWTGDDALEGTVSFADGPALAAASDVTFRNDLAEVWDWELVGAPDSTTTGASPAVTLEMVNTGNGCRVLDERTPYEGAGIDDGAASTALVEDSLSGAEIVAGPAQGLLGLGEGLGEDGPTYTVAQALGRNEDRRWLLVTARVFGALSVQQVLTVSCASGGGVDRTHGQLVQVAYATLRGLQQYP